MSETSAQVRVLLGDAIRLMSTLPDSSVDAVVTDPPYGLTSPPDAGGGAMLGQVSNWHATETHSRGYADHDSAAYQNFSAAWAAECFRLLKPGGHLIAFGGTRAWHRMACGIEDAGFEIRDNLAWLYASGFPKGLDLGKALSATDTPGDLDDEDLERWHGWATTLKPAFEPLVLARKPLDGTVLNNVTKWGVGALNIGANRGTNGRWTANALLDDLVVASLDNASGGVASRVLWVAKPSPRERVVVDGVAHPTVKPLTLMQWLVRLVTPPGGTLLDPFAGSGTTGEACIAEGMQCILMEAEEHYLPLIQMRISRRLDPATAGDLDGTLFEVA